MTQSEILDFVRSHALIPADETPSLTPLTGGVSSDIWKIETPSRTICIKRALAQLKTEKVWMAPVSRNAYEADWMRTAAAILPGAVPALLAEDTEAGMFAMSYLPPETHPVWKQELRDGNAEVSTAREVGVRLGRIHAATADSDAVAARFATDDIFHSIRIEPYLLRTAEAHPDMRDRLQSLAETTATTKRVLVHGDVSPKNILIGADGPVFLDAECAWFGDPAFDLGFCLNHLLLKCIWTPEAENGFMNCFDALATAYFAEVGWENPSALECRTAALLPGLLLARIDGASPVEYITLEQDKDRVRRAAKTALASGPARLEDVRTIFREAIHS